MKVTSLFIFKNKRNLVVWKAAEKSVNWERWKILERKERIIRQESMLSHQVKDQVRSPLSQGWNEALRHRDWVMPNKHRERCGEVVKGVDPGARQPGSEAEPLPFLVCCPRTIVFTFLCLHFLTCKTGILSVSVSSSQPSSQKEMCEYLESIQNRTWHMINFKCQLYLFFKITCCTGRVEERKLMSLKREKSLDSGLECYPHIVNPITTVTQNETPSNQQGACSFQHCLLLKYSQQSFVVDPTIILVCR